MNADQALAKLQENLAALDQAEATFRLVRRQYRQKHARLSEWESNRLADSDQRMRDCMTDWSTAHTRIQSYAAAATALLLAEEQHRELTRATPPDDERDWHPAVPNVPYDGFAVNGRRP